MLTLDLTASNVAPGERFLTIRFSQREATPWAPAGHEVAWEQIALPASAAAPAPTAPAQVAVEAREQASRIVLRAGDVRAEFDTDTGLLTAFAVGGENLLRRGPLLNVWRAAIDNDGLKLRDEPGKPLNRWRKLGLPNIAHRLNSIRLIEQDAGAATVEIVHAASGRGQWDDFSHIHRYTLLATGELRVENQVQLGEEIIDLPRVGVGLVLAPGLEQISWFGRGPWENYSDRKASATVGLWRSTVSEQYIPYIMPQETGHKCDVRWLTLTGEQERGLRVTGQPIFEFSALHLSDDDLYRATHTTDLAPRAEIFLNIDAAQRGVGTLSCGPDTLERYQLLESAYQFSFRLFALGS